MVLGSEPPPEPHPASPVTASNATEIAAVRVLMRTVDSFVAVPNCSARPRCSEALINRFSCWAMLAESPGMVNAFGALRSGWRTLIVLVGLLLLLRPVWAQWVQSVLARTVSRGASRN